MIGAIAGDVIGSVHEWSTSKVKDFPLFVDGSTFTDDTVLAVAVAGAVRRGEDYAIAMRRLGRRYPDAGYGGKFYEWLMHDGAGPYNSYGNGSAMRVAAIGWAFDDLDVVLSEASKSAEITHNHPEGISGAQAVAASILAARNGQTKEEIKELLTWQYGYDCTVRLSELRRDSSFDITCRGTVRAAAVAFLESTGFEDAIRNAISLGGDADTLACITGAMAEAWYGGVPPAIQAEVLSRLDFSLRSEVLEFAQAYGLPLDIQRFGTATIEPVWPAILYPQGMQTIGT
jgi:ADP-ribosylglycohydrolase